MLLVHFVHVDLAITVMIAHHLTGHIPTRFTQMYSHVLLDTATVAPNLCRSLVISLTDKVDVNGVGNTRISFLKGDCNHGLPSDNKMQGIQGRQDRKKIHIPMQGVWHQIPNRPAAVAPARKGKSLPAMRERRKQMRGRNTGVLSTRVPDEIYLKVHELAKLNGVTVNDWLKDLVSEEVNHHPKTSHRHEGDNAQDKSP